MRIILSIMLVLLYSKYWSITVDNVILYNTLVAIYEWLLILVIYFITKKKLNAVLIFAIVEMILYTINTDMILYQIILLRMLAIIFWLWIYSLWNNYWYRWYLAWILLHIIYNVSVETHYLSIVIWILLLFIYLILDSIDDSPI